MLNKELDTPLLFVNEVCLDFLVSDVQSNDFHCIIYPFFSWIILLSENVCWVISSFFLYLSLKWLVLIQCIKLVLVCKFFDISTIVWLAFLSTTDIILSNFNLYHSTTSSGMKYDSIFFFTFIASKYTYSGKNVIGDKPILLNHRCTKRYRLNLLCVRV